MRPNDDTSYAVLTSKLRSFRERAKSVQRRAVESAAKTGKRGTKEHRERSGVVSIGGRALAVIEVRVCMRGSVTVIFKSDYIQK